MLHQYIKMQIFLFISFISFILSQSDDISSVVSVPVPSPTSMMLSAPIQNTAMPQPNQTLNTDTSDPEGVGMIPLPTENSAGVGTFKNGTFKNRNGTVAKAKSHGAQNSVVYSALVGIVFLCVG